METLFNSPEKYKKHDKIVDGYKTHFIEGGFDNNARLLLVHGGSAALGAGLYRWWPTFLPLCKHFHTFAIDELGHGFTDPPRKEEDLGNVRVRAQHVIDFIDQENLGPLYLLGQSQGGWIVTYISITRPDLVRKLILVDSGSTAGSLVKNEGEADSQKIQEIDGEKMEIGSWELPYFKKIFEPGTMMPKIGMLETRSGIREYTEAFSSNHTMVTDEYIDYLEKTSKRWTKYYNERRGKNFWSKTNVAGQHDMYSFDGKHIREQVHKIKAPTFFIAGKNSCKGIDPQFQLYKKMANAQMHVLNQANHFCWWDQWQDFNDLVIWFLGRTQNN